MPHSSVRAVSASSLVLAAAAAALGQANPIPLNYNFNGLAHPGEFTGAANPGVADDPDGYRAISDRGLYINGAAGSFGTAPVVGATGLTYMLVTQAFTNDLVMLGNRNALWPFDAAPNTNNRGIRPNWLPEPDQSGPQTTFLPTPILLSETSQVGVLFQISNGGGTFSVVLTCSDGTQATAQLSGPDWFGSGNPVPPPRPGVQAQTRLGTFNASGNFDNPQPSGALNVIEGVIGVSNLLNAGLGDLRGRQLTAITFQDRVDANGVAIPLGAGNRSFAILAVTAGGAAAPANDTCATATPITEGTYTGSTGGAVGLEGASCGFADGADVWYRYTASTTGTARVSLCGSGFDTTVAVFSGSCGALGEFIACNDNFCDLSSRVDFSVVQGQQYLIRVAGTNADRGAFSMTVSSPPGVLAGPFINPADGHTFFLLQASSWPDAEADAQALGGHLTTIGSAAENAWIRQNVLNFDGGAVFRRGWIGLQRDGFGQFSTWADGQPVTFTNWAAGEPNNANGLEFYAEMLQDTGQWNDARELPGSSNHGIVEIPTLPTNPVGSGTASPATIVQGQSTVLRVAVVPAGPIVSTGITVTIDASAIGGTAALAAVDDGVDPDLVAGDGTYSARVATDISAPVGAFNLPFAIADDQGRSSGGSIAVTVNNAIGGCCQPASCSVITRNDCAAQGGTFLGHNIPCVTGDGYDIALADNAPFEDIIFTGNPLALTDDSNVNIPIGFNFTFYGNTYDSCFVCSNGFVAFGAGSNVFTNTAIPAAAVPNNALYALWDDLNPGAGGAVLYETLGTPGVDLRLIVQWNAVPQFNNTDANTFQIAIFENGTVEYRYQSITIQPAGDITIGVENQSGTEATSFDATTLGAGPISLRIAFRNGQNNCGSTCPADYNGDGTVDPDDLADYIACYFSQPPCPQADFNSDGTPDPDDLADYIAAYFGPPC